MISKYWTINSLLLVMIIVFAIHTYDLWIESPILAAGMSIEPAEKLEPAKVNLNRPKANNINEYQAMVEKNLFFPDRTGQTEKQQGAQHTAMPRKAEGFEKDIVLYGIMMSGGVKQALISNPAPGKKGGDPIWEKTDQKLPTNGGRT